jgi:dTDP-glucose 4,6-dehydratase
MKDNVEGTVNLLEWSRKQNLKKFLYFSTDEVYGPAIEGVSYKEEDRTRPNNPYAASKAAAESFCFAYQNTYKIPIIITRAMNIIGERQHPEKFLPLIIKKIFNKDKLLIHSSPGGKPGKRHYIHARDISNACIGLLQKGSINEVYNIVGEKEVDNLEFAKEVAFNVKRWLYENRKQILQLDYELVDFHSSRPGHDLRYAIDGSKLLEMGFEHSMTFEESIKEIVFSYLENIDKWL